MYRRICPPLFVLVFALAVVARLVASQDAMLPVTVESPDGRNTIQFDLADGYPEYQVSHGKVSVIEPSPMGFVFKKEGSTLGKMGVTAVEKTSADEKWTQVWGEKKEIRNHYKGS